MKGSVMMPRNCVIALKVVCCEPVALSPEACDRPPGVSVANTNGRLPAVIEEIAERVADRLLIAVERGRKRRSSGSG